MNYLKNLLRRYFYHDTCKVYRAVEVTNGYVDSVSEEFELVYANIPCKLSQYSHELSAYRDDRTQKITENLRLCYDPEYVILEDDVIEVFHQGQTFKLLAGVQFSYPTHCELSVRRRKEAGQE